MHCATQPNKGEEEEMLYIQLLKIKQMMHYTRMLKYDGSLIITQSYFYAWVSYSFN